MNQTKKILAIRGYMKSGTNWLSNILNLHPQVSCVGEFHWERVVEAFQKNAFGVYAKESSTNRQPEAMDRLNQFIYDMIVLANDPQKEWAGDRTPSTIDPEILRNAHYFDLIRDGRDVLVSRAYHIYRLPNTLPWFEQADDMRDNLEKFRENKHFFLENPDRLLSNRRFVRQTAIRWREITEHNQKVRKENPDMKIMGVRYERLHQDPEAGRAKLYEFLDLNPALAAPLTDNTTPGFGTDRPNNFFRKGAVGDWKNYFNDQAKKWFCQHAGDHLEKLGYLDESPW